MKAETSSDQILIRALPNFYEREKSARAAIYLNNVQN